VVCLIAAILLAIGDRVQPKFIQIKGNKMMHKNFRDDYVKTILNPEPDAYTAAGEERSGLR